jgi:hypothetical protein
MTDVHILAIDLAKRSFHVCATDRPSPMPSRFKKNARTIDPGVSDFRKLTSKFNSEVHAICTCRNIVGCTEAVRQI